MCDVPRWCLKCLQNMVQIPSTVVHDYVRIDVVVLENVLDWGVICIQMLCTDDYEVNVSLDVFTALLIWSEYLFSLSILMVEVICVSRWRWPSCDTSRHWRCRWNPLTSPTPVKPDSLSLASSRGPLNPRALMSARSHRRAHTHTHTHTQAPPCLSKAPIALYLSSLS